MPSSNEEETARKELSRALDLFRGDPRRALAVPLRASPVEVRRAFKELAKRYHPARYARHDPPIVRLSNEVFLALRDAQDAILAELEGEPPRVQGRTRTPMSPPAVTRAAAPVAEPTSAVATSVGSAPPRGPSAAPTTSGGRPVIVPPPPATASPSSSAPATSGGRPVIVPPPPATASPSSSAPATSGGRPVIVPPPPATASPSSSAPATSGGRPVIVPPPPATASPSSSAPATSGGRPVIVPPPPATASPSSSAPATSGGRPVIVPPPPATTRPGAGPAPAAPAPSRTAGGAAAAVPSQRAAPPPAATVGRPIRDVAVERSPAREVTPAREASSARGTPAPPPPAAPSAAPTPPRKRPSATLPGKQPRLSPDEARAAAEAAAGERVRFERALDAIRHHRWSEARSELESLAGSSPADLRYQAYLHYVQGWEAYQLGRDTDARGHWQRALTCDPGLGLARWALESTGLGR